MKKIFPLIAIFLLVGQIVSAASLVPCGRKADDPETPEDETTPCQLCHFFVLLQRILNFLLIGVFMLAVVLFVYTGFKLVLSQGNPGAVKEAIGIGKSVAIGLVIVFSSWIITNTFFTFIGIADWTGLKSGWFKINCQIEE